MADKRRTRKRTEKENEKPCSKEEYSIAKHLRFNCAIRDAKFIPMGTVVKTFVASDAIDLLLKSKWAKPTKSDILLADRKSCEKFCERLLQKGLFHRAFKLERRKDKVLDKKKKKKKTEELEIEEEKVDKDKKTTKKDKKSKKDKAIEEKETDEKDEEKSEDKSKQEAKKDDEKNKDDDKKKDDEKKKKERKLKVDMHDDQVFLDGSDVYVWIYDPVPAKTFVIGLLMVVGAAALCVFPLWPDELRVGVYYCSLTGASFVGFILFLVLVRFLLFCVIWTVTVGKIHFWFLPNLTEDVGFFDSFKPLYKCDIYSGKEEEEDDIKKKKKDKKPKKEKEVEEKQEAQEQGFELVQREDVEENVEESEKKISEDEKEVDEDEEVNEDEEEEIEEDVDEHEYETKKEK